jgi:hypothetical protein
MTVALLVAVLASTLSGLACTLGLWTRRTPLLPQIAVVASLAVGLGLGLSACGSFLSLSLVGARPHGFILGDVALLVLVGILAGLRSFAGRAPHAVADVPIAAPPPGLRPVLAGSLAVTAACALLAFLLLSFRNPHGQWDAWAIWNLHARFIARAGSEWRELFTDLLRWSHPDYPLLLPLNVARLWQYLGRESPAAPTAIAMLFTFSTVGLLWGALAILRGSNQAALAGLLLLGTPALIRSAASQEADVPLAFFLLATLAALALKDRLPRQARQLLVVAGMTGGLAAWTKNEGWLALAAVVLAQAAVAGRTWRWAAWLRELPLFLLGLVPVLLVVLYFKFSLAPPNDLLSGHGWRRLLESARYVQVLWGFRRAVEDLGDTTLFNPVLALLFYLVCVGLEPDQRDRTSLATGGVALSLMVVGYALVYVVSPYDLAWHLSTSALRLLMQLWPSAVFLAFLAACPPEQSKG